jgi:hypothetical protein
MFSGVQRSARDFLSSISTELGVAYHSICVHSLGETCSILLSIWGVVEYSSIDRLIHDIVAGFSQYYKKSEFSRRNATQTPSDSLMDLNGPDGLRTV